MHFKTLLIALIVAEGKIRFFRRFRRKWSLADEPTKDVLSSDYRLGIPGTYHAFPWNEDVAVGEEVAPENQRGQSSLSDEYRPQIMADTSDTEPVVKTRYRKNKPRSK